MTTKRLIAVLLIALATTIALARTRRGTPEDAPSRTFQVTGVIVAPIADGRVTVAHDDIPGYMPAMTMPFAVGPDAQPALMAGDRVRFTLRVAAEWSRAEAFEVSGHDASMPAAAKAGAPTAARRVKTGDVLPAFALTTHEGRAFTSVDLRGRVTALTFVFTRCPVPEFCPLMVKRFKELQRRLAADESLRNVRLVSVTLDPEFDTPSVLAAYAQAMHVNPAKWLFVTGPPPAVENFAAAFSIHVERNGVLLDHTLATAVIGPDGRVVEIWRGNGWKVDEILSVLSRAAASRE